MLTESSYGTPRLLLYPSCEWFLTGGVFFRTPGGLDRDVCLLSLLLLFLLLPFVFAGLLLRLLLMCTYLHLLPCLQVPCLA